MQANLDGVEMSRNKTVLIFENFKSMNINTFIFVIMEANELIFF